MKRKRNGCGCTQRNPSRTQAHAEGDVLLVARGTDYDIVSFYEGFESAREPCVRWQHRCGSHRTVFFGTLTDRGIDWTRALARGNKAYLKRVDARFAATMRDVVLPALEADPAALRVWGLAKYVRLKTLVEPRALARGNKAYLKRVDARFAATMRDVVLPALEADPAALRAWGMANYVRLKTLVEPRARNPAHGGDIGAAETARIERELASPDVRTYGGRKRNPAGRAILEVDRMRGQTRYIVSARRPLLRRNEIATMLVSAPVFGGVWFKIVFPGPDLQGSETELGGAYDTRTGDLTWRYAFRRPSFNGREVKQDVAAVVDAHAATLDKLLFLLADPPQPLEGGGTYTIDW